MITRSTAAARRRRLQSQIAASFAQLNLPWLAPAQLRWAASQSTESKLSIHRPRRRSIGRNSHVVDSARRLATAADAHSVSNDYSSAWHWNAGDHSPSLTTIQAPASLVMPPTISRAQATRVIKVQHGIAGNVQELLQHLHTNLRVGRMQRARAIMSRLSTDTGNESPEVSYAHRIYLEGLLRKLMSQPASSLEAQNLMNEMQEWFDHEIQEHGVLVDAQILIPMVRAAIHIRADTDREEAVQKYLGMAAELGDDVHDDVVYAEDYTDAEFAVLMAITGDQVESSTIELLEQPAGHTTAAAQQVTSQHDVDYAYMDLSDIPAVLPTPQRGAGLDSVKEVLKPMTKSGSSAQVNNDDWIANAHERQRILEETAVEVAVNRWRQEDEELRKIGINTAMQTRPIGALLWQWYSALLPALEAELVECRKLMDMPKTKEDERLHYGPYLELLPLDKMAANTILYVLSILTNGREKTISEGRTTTHPSIARLTVGLGKAIEAEVKAHTQGDKSLFARAKSQPSRTALARRRAKRSTAHSSTKGAPELMTWPIATQVRLGAMLISKLMETAQMPVTREHIRTKERITQLQPAFLHRSNYVRGRRVNTLAANPALLNKLQAEPVGSLIAKRMPMIVEPKPWSGWNTGAYHYYKNNIVRLAQGEKQAQEYFLAAHNQGDLEQVYAGLNALSKVPWRVHRDIFKVQLEAWNSGEPIANFAPLHPEIDIPPEPEPSADPGPRKQWLALVRDIEAKKGGMHSQRCFQNFQLETARSFINETLYFPHNMDFRGRAYPIPPYLNHMGADNARALLVFAEGKELGKEGLRWLKIHLANVAGYDKASLQEREEYTMAHLEDIRDSVANPLDGRKWWLKSEDAWQTLAACFELVRALDSSDPERFISHLPIHQDGTCNGLQHYAALGGDVAGAMHVNLEPGDRPADVYAGVAKAVEVEVNKDAAAGVPVARFLQGHIGRKVVKQPVMTNVYGVTYYGAKAQVKKQLEDIFPDVTRFDDITHTDMAAYITDKIFKSLGTMFTGAQAIQNWLGECADVITTCLTPEQVERLITSDGVGEKPVRRLQKRVTDKPEKVRTTRSKDDKALRTDVKALLRSTVVWTTPLRLPVVQPYRSAQTKPIVTSLQAVGIQEPHAWDPVSRRKQLQAFPPNFIHSLDATHMLLSALKCNEAGITFASIHDSFWTHATDITRMSVALRDAFVIMHSDDIIGRLREEFQTRYKNCMRMSTIDRRGELGAQITKWRAENAKLLTRTYSELAMEVERVRLLRSDDQEERQQGLAMITPASICEAHGELPAKTALAGATLGEIPADADAETPAEAPTTQRNQRLCVWRAVEFPAVPQKGSFDVTRLRESKYFFH